MTDAGLANLKGFDALHTLELAGSEVTDAGLVQLKGLPQLALLDLGRTKVTDAGLKSLEGYSTQISRPRRNHSHREGSANTSTGIAEV